MKAGGWLNLAAAQLPVAASPGALLGAAAPLLVLAPHPDDESLGCGALIAACAAEGRAVRILVVSDGRFSHPGSRRWPAPRLIALRAQETRQAVAALGLDPHRDLRFLGLPDRSVPAAGLALEAACATIRDSLPTPPGAILAPWRHDPHCDHAATAAIASALAAQWRARLLSYVVWGWAYTTPLPGFALGEEPEVTGPPRGWRFAATPWLAAKRRAIAAHRSQMTDLIDDDPTGFRLPDQAIALLTRPEELYLA
ncbi:MAG TPA: PIG-L deacetylase family protein [Roseomonas sp.]|jgi:LmbE family N-acetylglucosaminyl deacetylase